MAAVGEVQPRAGKKKGRKRRGMKRVSIRIDMTPMVDVAFLLLTFFMLTTVFAAPQTMEITLPPTKAQVEVAESNLLTLRVAEDGTLYWNLGFAKPQRLEFSGLHQLLVSQNAANPKLINVIKVDRKAKYHTMVDIMDEIQIADVQRFSLIPMTDDDRKEIAKVAQ